MLLVLHSMLLVLQSAEQLLLWHPSQYPACSVILMIHNES